MANTLARQKLIASNLKNAVDDICLSVFYFLGPAGEYTSTTPVPKPSDDMVEADNMSSRTAFLLLFPLVTTVTLPGVPQYQRAWIKERLIFVSKVVCSKDLESLARAV